MLRWLVFLARLTVILHDYQSEYETNQGNQVEQAPPSTAICVMESANRHAYEWNNGTIWHQFVLTGRLAP